MENVKDIISDEELKNVWQNSNFGAANKRDVLKFGLLKHACGYKNGHTLEQILNELDLVVGDRLSLFGKKYLYAAFAAGNNI